MKACPNNKKRARAEDAGFSAIVVTLDTFYLAWRPRDLGNPQAASWAYRRKRRMEKLAAREQGRVAVGRREWGAAAGWFGHNRWGGPGSESIEATRATFLAP